MSKRKIVLLLIGLLVFGSLGAYAVIKQRGRADVNNQPITNFKGYHQNNVKKPDLFTDKPVLILKRDNSYSTYSESVSMDQPLYNWQNFLPAVPMAIWTDSSGKVQKIPILTISVPSNWQVDKNYEEIFREKDFSTVYFLQQYKPTKVIIPKDESLKTMLTVKSINGPNIPTDRIFEVENMFIDPANFWSSIEDLVFIDDDKNVGRYYIFNNNDLDQKYEDGLIGSTYASFINAPVATNKQALEKVFNNPTLMANLKKIIIIGQESGEMENYINSVKRPDQQVSKMSAQDVQKEILAITKTNKFILADTYGATREPGDKIIDENSGQTILTYWNKTKLFPDPNSLLAAILAAGKQELIIPIHANATKQSSKNDLAAQVNRELRSNLVNLGVKIEGDQYLTIVASPYYIPQGVNANSKLDIQYANGEHLGYWNAPERLGGNITEEELDNRLYGAKEDRSQEYVTADQSRSWLSEGIRFVAHAGGEVVSAATSVIGDGFEWLGDRVGGDIGQAFQGMGIGIRQGGAWAGGLIDFVANAGLAISQGTIAWIVYGEDFNQTIIETFVNGIKKAIVIKLADPKINKPVEVHFKVGRIYGKESGGFANPQLSDVSGYFARDLFYDVLPNKSNRALSVIAGDDQLFNQYLGYNEAQAKQKLNWWYNTYNGWSQYKNLFSQNSKEYYGTAETHEKRKEIFDQYQRSGLIVYGDHGSASGWHEILYNDAFYNAALKIPPAVVITGACHLASDQNSNNFSINNIKHGAMAVYGSINTNYIHRNYDDMLEAFKAKDIGTAMRDGKNKYGDGGMFEPMNFPNYNYVLIGDPTFKPTIPPTDNYPEEFLSKEIANVDPAGKIEEGISRFQVYSRDNTVPAIVSYWISDYETFSIDRDIIGMSLNISTLSGQIIRTIKYLPHSLGMNYIYWDGRDDQKKPIPNGTYLFTLMPELSDRILSLPVNQQRYPRQLIYSATFTGIDLKANEAFENQKKTLSPSYVGPGINIYNSTINPTSKLPTFIYFTPSVDALVSAKVYSAPSNPIRNLWQDKLVTRGSNASIYWDGKDSQNKQVPLNTGYRIELSFKDKNGQQFNSYYNSPTDYLAEYHLSPKFYDQDRADYIAALEKYKTGIKDTTPPKISNIQVKSISANSISLAWATDEEAESKFEYWQTDTYGNQSKIAEFVKSSTVNLQNLQTNGFYFYRIISADRWGNRTFSPDYYFDLIRSAEENTPIDFGYTPPANGKPFVSAPTIAPAISYFDKGQSFIQRENPFDRNQVMTVDSINNGWIIYAADFGTLSKNWRLTLKGMNFGNQPLANSDIKFKVYLDNDGSGKFWYQSGSITYPVTTDRYSEEGYLDLKNIKGKHLIRLQFDKDYFKQNAYDNNGLIKEFRIEESKNLAPAITKLEAKYQNPYYWFEWNGVDQENSTLYYRFKLETNDGQTIKINPWSSWASVHKSPGYQIASLINKGYIYTAYLQAKDKEGNVSQTALFILKK